MNYKVTIYPDAKRSNAILRGCVKYQGQRLRFTLAHVDANDPQKWDDTARKCVPKTRHGKNNVNAAVINKEIDKFVNSVDSFFILHGSDNVEPSIWDLSRHIREKMGFGGEEKDVRAGSLLFHFDVFIREGADGRGWSHATMLKYRTLKKDLETLCPNLTYADINEEFMNNFKNKLIGKGNRNETIQKKIVHFNCFLAWAREKRYCPRLELHAFKAKLRTTERPVIFLTWPELMRVYRLTFEENKKYLERARDVFCFLCFTGLRYSDVAKLEKDHIAYDRVNGATLKTGALLKVELNDFSKAILDKYKDYDEVDELPANRIGRKVKKTNSALPVISSQKLNGYIKEIAKLAKIDAPITTSHYVGIKRIDEVKPKYELITSHAGRRTFICTALSLNIPITTVMEWSGHKSYDEMKPYIAAASQYRRKEMNKFNNASELLGE